MISLKRHGLRDTQQRRMVVEAMNGLAKPASPHDIHAWITKSGGVLNLVTVYRILSLFEKRGLIHRHACNGLMTLCSLPDTEGHHSFLHCHSCGLVEEFSDPALCRAENAIAKRARFVPTKHVSEILGLCSSCS